MRQEHGPASFDNRPLPSLRNLTPDFFSEDPTSHVPWHSPTRHEVAQRTSHTETVDNIEPVYTSDSSELGNETLPVYGYRKEIVDAVASNPFTIVVAETGAGKSTQMPQFLLDAGWDTVYLTQPRRAAARNVYSRIHDEVGQVRGMAEADALVSYQTAGERDGTQDARIKVVTDGLQLMRELNKDGIVKNDVLVIDEVHEWNDNIEVLVAWSKKAVIENPRLRFVIMSATMDADRLANYFSEVCPKTPPIIEIPGRTYKVESSERPESTVVQEVVKAAASLHAETTPDKANGILVFMPGKREIHDAIDELRHALPLEIAKTATILPLHAKLSVQEQQAAFASYAGIKIVVATDVAQTSLTIPDIKYVIDSGYQRRMELDHEGVQGLVLNPTSQADCAQRAGRAGRVSDGHYVLTRLDSKTPHTPHVAREPYPMPEILRTDIVRNTLRVANVGLDISELDLYHPVDQQVCEQAQETLRTLGALDDNNQITPLGIRMNQFPVAASSARMMVEGDRFSGQIRAYLAAMVAAKEVGGLPYFAYNVDKRWRELSDETSSDLLVQLDIFIATQGMTDAQLREYDLDLHNVDRAREQYRKIAKLASALTETELAPPTDKEREDIKECIYAGLITSIYKHSGSGTYTHVGNPDTAREISNRSRVTGSPPVIVGYPFRVQYAGSGGEREERHVLEHVTAITARSLGKVAMHLSEQTSEGLTMRGGQFYELRRRSVFGIDVGRVEEVVAEPSPKLREAIINHVLENAGPQQQRLRQIKKELEELAHLAKDPVEQLTHDQIVEIVHAATPANITDPSLVDNNLRLMINDNGITLDSFITPERRHRIIEDAPGTIHVEGVSLTLSYRKSYPLVRHYRIKDIARLKNEVFLADGRQVYFVHERKRCSLMELKGKLGA